MEALSSKLIYLGAVPARKYAYCPDNLPGGLLSEVLAQKSWRSGLLVSTSVPSFRSLLLNNENMNKKMINFVTNLLRNI